MPAKPPHIGFIHILRAIAAMMVVYCHLLGGRAEQFGNHVLPHRLLVTYFIKPLGITQDFGFLGVALFFLISGFVIAHTAQFESRFSFVVKRVFRIYPALIVAIVIATAIYQLDALRVGQPTMYSTIPVHNILWSMSALDVIVGTPVSSLAVGWTLTIELVFYIHAIIIFPLLRSRPAFASALLIAWGIVGTGIFERFAPTKMLGEMTQYLPLFAIGVAVSGWSRAANGRHGSLILFVLAGLSAYIYNLVTMKPWALLPEQSFAVQVGYAIAIFLLFCHVGSRLAQPRVMNWLGDISYSLYLIHLPVGMLVSAVAFTYVNAYFAILAGFLAALAMAWLMHIWVERPAQRYARRLLALRSRPSLAAGASSA